MAEKRDHKKEVTAIVIAVLVLALILIFVYSEPESDQSGTEFPVPEFEPLSEQEFNDKLTPPVTDVPVDPAIIDSLTSDPTQ